MNVYFHSGDLGDLIAALPSIRQLGGGRLILGNRNGIGAREPMSKEKFDVIAPLLVSQEYISEVIHQDDPSEVTHCLHHFRTKAPPYQAKGCGVLGYNLATWQANWLGIAPIDLDLSPWLRTDSSVTQESRNGIGAVFARSLRYRNHRFDWRKTINDWISPAFVGLPEEYEDFVSQFSNGQHDAFPIHIPTKDLLEVARLIETSECFVGNQSAPCWIALGMGKNLVQEMDTWEINRNSVIERENATYVG